MVKSSSTKQYLKANKSLTPLNGKIPIEKDWPNKKFDDEYLLNYKGNLGWVLSDTDLVIDVDPRNGGDESFEKLEEDFNLEFNKTFQPTVTTPRGGFHIYLSKPGHIKIKKNLKEYPGIDFLSKGCYCLIHGCLTKDGGYEWSDDLLGSFRQKEFSEYLLLSKALESNINILKVKKDEDLGDFTGLISESHSTQTEEQVKTLLEKLDPNCQNDEWVKIGMALHSWDTIEGLKLWEEWSKEGETYKQGETEKRWRSFSIDSGVTLGTLNYKAKEADFDTAQQTVDKFITLINKSNEKELQFDIPSKLKKESFSSIDKEKLVKTIQDRFKKLTDVRLPISKVRGMLTCSSTTEDSYSLKPDWCKDWVYINNHTAFAHVPTLKICKTESFNIQNGKHIPASDGGSKISASKYVADQGHINIVDSMAYLPSITDAICTINGQKLLNTFNPNSIPKEAPSFTPKGLEAIQLITNHIKFICSTEENSNIFTQWLAHNIQFQGKQILWSPVIQSIQGIGKSFFAELLRACLGDKNIGTVSPSQVISDFNGWATNVSVNVLEELRVKGHNRYEAINSLKPLITDRMIQINDKGVKQYMTQNTTNYICFTNHKDALPLDGDDRRWWVIFVPIDSLDEMATHVGMPAQDYFPKLFNTLYEHASEIRKYFLDYKITDEFMKIRQAPMTDNKLSMIATEDSSIEGYDELKELIEEGGTYFNKEVVCCNDLFETLLFKEPNLDINGKGRNILLKKLGYSKIPKQVKVGGKPRNVWARKPLSNDEVRGKLEAL